MGKIRYSIKIRERIRRSKFTFKFIYTRRQLLEHYFGKEMVKFFYKNFTGKKGFVIPKPVVDVSSFRSNLFERLGNKQRYFIPLMAAMLFVFIGVDFINAAVISKEKGNKEKLLKKEILLDGKTIKGYVVDENNNPWNNQLATVMIGDSVIKTDTIRNGNFEITDIITAIEDEQRTIPKNFKLEQNYPNPFNPSTTIQYNLTNTSSVILEVYNILGQKVKTLVNTTQNAGVHSVVWDGTNDNNERISSGVYIYREIVHNQVTNKETSKAKKAVYEKHAPNNNVWGRTSNTQQQFRTNNNKEQAQLRKSASEDYKLVISGADVMTTTQTLNLDQPTPIDLGTIIANAKPIIKSAANGVYDIDTKFDADNNRVTPSKIANLKVTLGSDPNIFTFTDANGQFTLKVDKTGIDSLFITGANPADTTYYNFYLPKININLGNNEITAFNDTTGIPMISRMWDTGLTTNTQNNVSVDFLDYLFYVTGVKQRFVGDPNWENILPRVRDEDLPIKVFMNRAIDPTNGWYADSSMAGLKATETGRYKFQEVSTADSALLIMRYDHNQVGQGTNIKVNFDTSGYYISHWEIRIRGPQGQSILLQPRDVPMVVAHEDMHIAFAGGNHSLYKQDLFYGDALTRLDQGYPLKIQGREEKAVKTIYALERNPKLLNYTR